MNKNNGIATTTYNALVESVGKLLEYARKSVATAVNNTLVQTYWQIGRYIVEYEQNGKERAEYGSGLMSRLSKDLTQRYGKGFSERNIEQMRKFYISYPVCSEVPGKSISQTLSAEFSLSWSHYLGQMQMYVNFYDRFVKLAHENKTIGIVLCKKKDDALVEITLPEDNTQIFASKYQTVLPDKKTLQQLINETL